MPSEARAQAPRSSHADWEPVPDRPDPISLLEEQARARVPELIPIRYGRMSASPFAFYRGAAAIMASDLANTPASGIVVQLCGDAHLGNFGAFASPDRRLVFDVNDFDETLPGPWEWDVKRLAASAAVAGRELGLPVKQRRRLALAAARAYRETMRKLASMPTLDVWYARVETDEVIEALRRRLPSKRIARVERGLDRAHQKDSMRALAKLCERVNGRSRIASDPPLVVPLRELLSDGHEEQARAALEDIFRRYRETLRPDLRRILSSYEFVDAARKVVGVGSVGTRAWIVLLMGRDDGDPLFLQAKEAGRSVLEPFARRSTFRKHGRRVVEGQRLLQPASDVLLGWTTASDPDGSRHDFYVRQLWDWKLSADVVSMKPDGLMAYGELCGATLARGHARSGDRAAIGAYLGSGPRFDEAIAEFAERYADQNERDYSALVGAIESGRIEAAPA
jgi:uncharacterized protein (DUF2252 family)